MKAILRKDNCLVTIEEKPRGHYITKVEGNR